MGFSKTDIDNLGHCFSNYGYDIIDVSECIEYLENRSFCLFTYEQIIMRFCEQMEIKCPMEYLNCDYIYSGLQFDYYEINDDLFLDLDLFSDGSDDCNEMINLNIIKME